VLVAVEGQTLCVEDGGPVLVAETWPALLAGQLEPGAAGRPSTMVPFCAGVLASHLGVEIAPGDAARGKVVVRFGL
jgi:hypothetical protein